jgi:hypothetical protein
MPARRTTGWAALMLLALALPAAAEDKQQPDVELLEYLGEWAGTDKDWTDPVDILDMKIDDSKDNGKAKVSEKRNDT